MTAAALLLGSGAGAAIAADGARPGDLLYGIDRALEAVGIGNGGAVERLEEAQSLIGHGDLADGLGHLPEVIDSTTVDGADEAGYRAREALRAAAERIRSTETQEPSANLAVADLLEYLSENIGHVDGARVAELSLLIADARQADHGRGHFDVPEPAGPRLETPPSPEAPASPHPTPQQPADPTPPNPNGPAQPATPSGTNGPPGTDPTPPGKGH